jgi:glycosyltransferase involved in cell wall biosynthesis
VKFRAALVGGGALLESHRFLAAQLGLAESVSLVGRVEDAYAFLQHADIFVLPSLEEGSGSVSLLEAMQAGAVPVVSRVDGLPEDIVDEQTGFLVEPGNVDDLSRRLEHLLLDSELRSTVSSAAHALYRIRFSASAFTNDLIRAYSQLGFLPPQTQI